MVLPESQAADHDGRSIFPDVHWVLEVDQGRVVDLVAGDPQAVDGELAPVLPVGLAETLVLLPVGYGLVHCPVEAIQLRTGIYRRDSRLCSPGHNPRRLLQPTLIRITLIILNIKKMPQHIHTLVARLASFGGEVVVDSLGAHII